MKSTIILLAVLSAMLWRAADLQGRRAQADVPDAWISPEGTHPPALPRIDRHVERALPADHEPFSGSEDPCRRVRLKAAYGLGSYAHDRYDALVPEDPVRDDGAVPAMSYRELREAVCSPEARARNRFLRKTFELPARRWHRSAESAIFRCGVIASGLSSSWTGDGALREIACDPQSPSGAQPISTLFNCAGELAGAQGALHDPTAAPGAEGAEVGHLERLVRLMIYLEGRRDVRPAASRGDCGELDGLTGEWRPQTRYGLLQDRL